MKNLFKSLAAFQQEVPVIHKGTQGYGYSYADLPKIFEVINPLLQKHGLGFTQLVDNNSIKTILFHVESGETIDSCTYVPFDSLNYEEVIKVDRQGNEVKANVIKGFEGMNKAQAIGSMITYFRRYALSAILGIVTDKDTDGSSVKTTNVVKKPTIQGERFLKAVEAIRAGEFTAEELQAKFELNEVQQKALLLI